MYCRTLGRLQYVQRRLFSQSANLLAPRQKEGKKKAKQGFKSKSQVKAPIKKSGMTHLRFRYAVRSLRFEKGAKDISSLGTEELKYGPLKSLASSVVKYDEYARKVLQDLGSFKKYQKHELLSEPASVVSSNTIGLAESFISKLNSPSTNNRMYLLGEKGVGKSVLLTQIKALSLSKYNNDVVLIHLDYPEKIVEGSSDYIFNKSLQKYQQPMFTKRWIIKLRSANEQVFKKMPLTRDVSFISQKKEYNLKKNENTLYDFILYNHDFGKFGPSTAFKFLIEEIEHHSKSFPVLVSVDNFNALLTKTFTSYRHPDFRRIHFSEFEIGDFLLKLASGQLGFEKGGVLVAESKDIGDSLTSSVGLGLTEYNPYFKKVDCDYDVASALLSNGGMNHFNVENLDKKESEELLYFLRAADVLKVRDYPCKEAYKSFLEVLQEQTAEKTKPNANQEEHDLEEQYKKIVQNNYTMSSGNPGHLINATCLDY